MNCPSCHQDVDVSEQNYGALFTCPGCQAVYFVNFDGQPEYDDQSPPPVPNSFTEEVQAKQEGSADILYQLNNPFEMPETEPEDLRNFSQVAESISNFGNSEMQNATLNYDLKVRGLDSKEIMMAFKEAIQDSRFGWESLDIMKKIKSGELILEKLSPVAAYILAKRLKFLDLELVWKQHVLD